MNNILFICTGNTCRSPMAAALFNDMRAGQGLPPAAESAGLAAVPGEPAAENAVAALRELGIDLSAHRARRLTRALLENCGAAYAMSASHRALIAAMAPELLHKVHVLGGGIDDPFGQDIGIYRACRDALQTALRAMPAAYFAP